MPVKGKVIGKYVAKNTSGTLMHYGATKNYSYYTRDTQYTYFSPGNDLTNAQTWTGTTETTFPNIPFSNGVQYDPYTDTIIRNDVQKLVEISCATITTTRSISVLGIPGFDQQNAILIGLGGENYFYYLIRNSGGLFKINRDFSGEPKAVGQIPTSMFANTWALGGFFYRDNVYLLNKTGSVVEIPISNPLSSRIVFSGLDNSWFLFPMLIYRPEQVLKRFLYFTLCDFNGNDYQLCQMDLGTPPNPPIPTSYKGTKEEPYVYGWTDPSLGWTFSDPDAGDKATAFQVHVLDGVTGAMIHDTGKTNSNASHFVYNGPALEWNRLYIWRVKVWDMDQQESMWSADQYFIPNKPPSVRDLTGSGYYDAVAIGLTPRLSFKVVDLDTYPIQGFQIMIKQTKPAEKIVMPYTTLETTNPWYDVPAGLLQEDSSYTWEVRAKDRFGAWGSVASAQFCTTSKPPAPFLLSPLHGIRTVPTPTFHAAINSDQTGDHQHFRLQLALDDKYAGIVKAFDTQLEPQGWEVWDGNEWRPFPIDGVRRTRQLVQNADFSSHGDAATTIPGWSPHNFWGHPDLIDVISQTSDGVKALRIVNESGRTNWGMRQLLKGWKPGDKLKITLDARVVRLGPSAALKVWLQSEHGIRLNETVLALSEIMERSQTHVAEVVLPDDQSLDVLYLYLGFEGSQLAGSECHIQSVSAEVLYVVGYREVRFTPQESLPPDRYWWRMLSISEEQKTLSEPTDAISLVNHFILTTDTSTDPVGSWHYGFDAYSNQFDYQIELLPEAYPDGSYVIDARAASPDTQLQLTKYFRGEAGKYYLCMLRTKSNYPSVAIDINGFPGPRLTEANTWQTLYMKTVGGGNSLALGVTMLQTKSDQVTSLSQVIIYEISHAEYERIDTHPAWTGDNLLLRYPHVQGSVILQKPRAVSPGQELSFLLTAPVHTSRAASRITLNAVWKHPTEKSASMAIPFDAASIVYESVDGDWMANHDETTITAGMGSARLSFRGTGIRWYGKKTPNSYIAYVLIDDVFYAQIDQYAETEEEALLFEKNDLSYGEHSITIITTAIYNPNCDLPVYRTHIRSFEVLTDEPPASIALHACNNGFDDDPVWEDLTDSLLNNTRYTFVNQRKSAAKWGINIRMAITANGTLSPVEVDGFGFSFE